MQTRFVTEDGGVRCGPTSASRTHQGDARLKELQWSVVGCFDYKENLSAMRAEIALCTSIARLVNAKHVLCRSRGNVIHCTTIVSMCTFVGFRCTSCAA